MLHFAELFSKWCICGEKMDSFWGVASVQLQVTSEEK
jgi:hypothetical protein